MAEKRKFSQSEVNRIINSRLKRENTRLTKDFEKRLKHCMAAVHLTLYQELCLLKKEFEGVTDEMSMLELVNDSDMQQNILDKTNSCKKQDKGAMGND